MTVLVTGGSGQLGQALGALLPEAVCVSRPTFDFDRPETIAEVFDRTAPSLVINAAAWTAVDAAESAPEAAARANAHAPAMLARLCEGAGIPLIHLSTDYVFDGLKGEPYVESDPTSPTGVYGRTKLAGEQAVLEGCTRAVVLRTSWVYAATGRNFVRTMLDAARTRPSLRVVGDQIGCPTYAADLAQAVGAIAGRVGRAWQPSLRGVFHAAGTGSTSWHGLAEATFGVAATYGYKSPTVTRVGTSDWPTAARRPPDSRLDCASLDAVYGIVLPPWQDSLARCLGVVFRQSQAA